MRLHAQRGEDVRLIHLFDKIGRTNKIAVEFGAIDGLHASNTAWFRLKEQWKVALFDRAPLAPIVTGATITAENINQVFRDAGIPPTFDLLSIDIDGNDLWVWQACTFTPRVVVIEFNPRWGPSKSRAVRYDPDRVWDGSDYYGASITALCRVGERKGYVLYAATRSNLIFVRRELGTRNLLPEQIKRRKKRKPADSLHRKWVDVRC